MDDKHRIITILKDKVQRDYKDDIAIFAVYGSYARGTNDEKSDIDFFYIPKTDHAYAFTHQFIIDGIGYDLFPISWERIAGIAAFKEPLVSIISDSKVMYAATDEDLNRYEAFRTSILKTHTPEAEPFMMNKSFDYLTESFTYLHNMKREAETLLDLRIESSKIVSKIALAVAFANQTFYKGGLGNNVKESFEFKSLPKEYKGLIDIIISAEDGPQLIEASEKLVTNTRQFLLEQIRSKPERESPETFFAGFYEELKSVFNKMLRACDQQDEYTAFMTAAYLLEEVGQFLAKAEEGIWYNDRNYYREYSQSFESIIRVDLMALVVNKDYTALKEAVLQLEAKLVTYLLNNNVPITTYDSIDEFAEAEGRF